MNIITVDPRAGDDSVGHVDFDAFFRSELRPAGQLAFLMLGSTQSVDDVIQDAFCKVLERWESLDNPAAYLRVAVINRCRHLHRRSAVARRLAPYVRRVDPAYVDPPDVLSDALRSLTPRRRAVVVLRYFHDMSVPEIADALGISAGTVKSTLHRSLAALQEALQ